MAARAAVASFAAAVKAAQVALAGTQQEALVGSRTVLDVLISQQQLFTTQSQLVGAQHDAAVAEFNLAAAIGRLVAPEPAAGAALRHGPALPRGEKQVAELRQRPQGIAALLFLGPHGSNFVIWARPRRALVMSMFDGKFEPSMEEIPGSIRRILAEDERGARPLLPRARTASDVLALTEAIGDDGTVRHLAPKARRLGTAPPPLPDGRVEPVPPRPEAPAPASASSPVLAADAVAASFAPLAEAPREAPAAAEADTGRALDDIVRETLRPLLQGWLDEHLPALVERLVQEEIARMIGDAGDR